MSEAIREPRVRWRTVGLGLVASLAALVLLVLYAAVLTSLFQLHLNDLGKFWYGARDLFLDGASPYGPNPATQIPTPENTSGEFLNLNPPHFYILLAPLVHLRELGVFLAWAGASLAGTLLSLGLARGELGLEAWTRGRWTAGLLLLLGSGASLSIFQTGQLTLLLLPLVTWAWLLGRGGRWGQASLWIGVLASIKPFFLIFAPLLLCSGRLRAGSLLLVGMALPYLLGLALLGPGVYAEWLGALHDVEWTWVQMNGSVIAMASRARSSSLPSSSARTWSCLWAWPEAWGWR